MRLSLKTEPEPLSIKLMSPPQVGAVELTEMERSSSLPRLGSSS